MQQHTTNKSTSEYEKKFGGPWASLGATGPQTFLGHSQLNFNQFSVTLAF